MGIAAEAEGRGEQDRGLGFAPDHDAPVPYMARTRDYYAALGYETPYRWSHFADVPFAAPRQPLAAAKVALVTTAAPYDPAKGGQGPWAPYNAAAKFYKVYAVPSEPVPDLRISHVGIDRKHTSQEDPRAWLPLRAMQTAAAEGRIGEMAGLVFGAPTNRSHRVTMFEDAPEMLRLVQAAGVEAAVLAPNCPVCHQTCALMARHLEAAGIATVIMGCAKDIVEHCGVPRFLFSDFPLGNPAGRPHDPASQAATLGYALDLLESATGPRTTRQSPLRWAEDADWKLDYCNLARIPAAELARRRQAFLEDKKTAHQRRAEDGRG